ncbi:sensor histidine kinase [Actinokineospora sp. HUAS TT18]|uniref:sensor histidine kinase n=1 Tax=Actinokineospora sp. HUAS TT18 TaxID=3447451 RepID=UPI003F52140C
MKPNWPVIGSVAVLVLGYLDLVQHYPEASGLILPAAVARAVPVLICRRAPVVAAWLAYLSCAGTALATVAVLPDDSDEPWPWAVSSVLVLAVMAWVLGVRGVRRDTVGLVALVAATGLGLAPASADPDAWLSAVGMALLVAAVAAAGEWWSGLRGQVVEEREQRVALEERARIAREMHDIVAHHMSIVAVSAETAPYRIPDLPDAARAELAEIAGTARASLTEMRRLLGVLRGGAVELAPQPGIGDLDALVAGVRGVPVTLECAVDEVPDTVGLAAYRIVQEGLSNVVRHAPGAATTVSVRQEGKAVVVEVANAAPERPPAPSPPGHGLRGVRERVEMLGGTLDIDHPDGGHRLRAVLPLGDQ